MLSAVRRSSGVQKTAARQGQRASYFPRHTFISPIAADLGIAGKPAPSRVIADRERYVCLVFPPAESASRGASMSPGQIGATLNWFSAGHYSTKISNYISGVLSPFTTRRRRRAVINVIPGRTLFPALHYARTVRRSPPLAIYGAATGETVSPLNKLIFRSDRSDSPGNRPRRCSVLRDIFSQLFFDYYPRQARRCGFFGRETIFPDV